MAEFDPFQSVRNASMLHGKIGPISWHDLVWVVQIYLVFYSYISHIVRQMSNGLYTYTTRIILYQVRTRRYNKVIEASD